MTANASTILLLGRTGVGKSSLINGLVGRPVAPVGEWMPTTMSVERYTADQADTRYILVDTPGLCDDLPEAGNDQRYLELVRASVPRVDHLWFVTRLDSARVEADEKRGIRMITEALGAELWRRGVIVFTFGDRVPLTRARDTLSTRGDLIRREIESVTTPEIARRLRAVSVNSNHSAGLRIVRTPTG